jgi:hypothetical protein
MIKIKEALICLFCSVLSTAAVGQQIYVQQPYDGYAEGQTIYIDSQGGKYVLHPDGRTRVTPMITIEGCDIGLKWAPIAGIYWCPTYTSNPDPVIVTPPTPTTQTPTVFPPDTQVTVPSAWSTFTPLDGGGGAVDIPTFPTFDPPVTPEPTIWYCNHNAWAYYTVSPDEGGNCSNH